MATLPLNILSPTPSYLMIRSGTAPPADASSSSRKNNKLPRMGDYYKVYYLLKKTAIEIMNENCTKEPMIEDYLGLFPNAYVQQVLEVDLRGKFLENIQPLLTIASNNGIEYMGKFFI
ncbi:hypothetical protein ACFE6N_22900 [Pedobacter sp. BG31]|uniref:hypothetical protein n=1 Tax=Pedobacter sp. BG31 TaxID=3349697 RepID=UPI0035F3F5C2